MLRFVEDVMRKNFACLLGSDSLYTGIQFLKESGLNQVPVVGASGRELIGILSNWNIVAYCQRDSCLTHLDPKIKISDVMEKKVVHCYPQSHCQRVAEVMVSAKLESLPVVNKSSKVMVGILTIRDIIDGIYLQNPLQKNVVNT